MWQVSRLTIPVCTSALHALGHVPRHENGSHEVSVNELPGSLRRGVLQQLELRNTRSVDKDVYLARPFLWTAISLLVKRAQQFEMYVYVNRRGKKKKKSEV